MTTWWSWGIYSCAIATVAVAQYVMGWACLNCLSAARGICNSRDLKNLSFCQFVVQFNLSLIYDWDTVVAMRVLLCHPFTLYEWTRRWRTRAWNWKVFADDVTMLYHSSFNFECFFIVIKLDQIGFNPFTNISSANVNRMTLICHLPWCLVSPAFAIPLLATMIIDHRSSIRTLLAASLPAPHHTGSGSVSARTFYSFFHDIC